MYKSTDKSNEADGFTLVEVLVVIAIVSVLMGILLPALGKVRRHARTMVGMGNMRQIANAVNCYAMENDESYPESVATIGDAAVHWHWQEPTRMIGVFALHPQQHRSMSGYLGGYIDDASIMFCPNAARKYKYFQEAWEADDGWKNPDTARFGGDPLTGIYCFYWNYIG